MKRIGYVLSLTLVVVGCSSGSQGTSAATGGRTRRSGDSGLHIDTSSSSRPVPAAPVVKTMPWTDSPLQPNRRDTWAHYIDPGPVHDAPECHLLALFVGASVGGAGGMQYLNITVQNRSRSPCALIGAPTVGLLDTQGHLIARLQPNGSTTRRLILVPTSWATLGGVIPISTSVCGNPVAAVAFGLDASATVTVPTSGTPPTTTRCFSGSSRDRTAPAPAFVPRVSPYSNPGVVSLSFGALRDGTKLDAPISVRRGQVLHYSITLTNTGLNVLPLETDTLSGTIDGDCPLYRPSLAPIVSPSLLLNCGKDGLSINPNEAVRFDLQLAIPADQPLGRTTLRWQYVEPNEPPLSRPILVTDH